jgi:hypothetical protein
MWVRRFNRPRVHYAGIDDQHGPWLFSDKKEAALNGKYSAKAVPVLVTITEVPPVKRKSRRDK